MRAAAHGTLPPPGLSLLPGQPAHRPPPHIPLPPARSPPPHAPHPMPPAPCPPPRAPTGELLSVPRELLGTWAFEIPQTEALASTGVPREWPQGDVGSPGSCAPPAPLGMLRRGGPSTPPCWPITALPFSNRSVLKYSASLQFYFLLVTFDIHRWELQGP